MAMDRFFSRSGLSVGVRLAGKGLVGLQLGVRLTARERCNEGFSRSGRIRTVRQERGWRWTRPRSWKAKEGQRGMGSRLLLQELPGGLQGLLWEGHGPSVAQEMVLGDSRP